MRQKPLQNLRRNGSSVVMILGLLAIAIAMSYSMMRSEVTSSQIQRNSEQVVGARQAALSGLATALRKIHKNDWGGVDSVISGSLSASETYEVTFAAGDAALTPGGADYGTLPYRVTITSVGRFEDPYDSTLFRKHTARAVVQLVPRKVADEPTDWSTFQLFTVWQGTQSTFQVELPSRIEGAVRVQGTLDIAEETISHNVPRDQYLLQLNAIRAATGTDDRPFDGPVHLDYDDNEDGKDRLDLLGASTVDEHNSEPFASDWQQPTPLTTYQIYPGGPNYYVQTIGPILENETLMPDPETNPFGLYYSPSPLEIKDNVTVQGTIFCQSDVKIQGYNVTLQGFDLPPLEGTTNLIQLPVVTCEDFIVKPNTSGSVSGFIAVFGKFEIESGPEFDMFSVTGRVVVSDEFLIRERNEWEATRWVIQFISWIPQIYIYPYFPDYMATQGRSSAPMFTFQPPGTSTDFHWKEPSDPVYEAHDDDEGLRWDLVRWDDAP